MKKPYTIHAEILEKLLRMAQITEDLRSEDGEEISCDEELMAECRSLREELVGVFLPLVGLLADAGILTMSIDLTTDPDIAKYSSIAGEGYEVFENGNIWIECEASMWVPKEQPFSKSQHIN